MLRPVVGVRDNGVSQVGGFGFLVIGDTGEPLAVSALSVRTGLGVSSSAYILQAIPKWEKVVSLSLGIAIGSFELTTCPLAKAVEMRPFVMFPRIYFLILKCYKVFKRPY